MNEKKDRFFFSFIIHHFFLSRAAEAAFAALGLAQIIAPDGLRRDDLLNHQLGHAHPGFYLDRLFAVIDQRAQNFATVIAINHSRQNIQPVLDRQSRTRSDAPVKSMRDGYGETCADGCTTARRDREALNRVEVKSGGKRAAARRQSRGRIQSHEL
jgi:hypothetical protein